MRLIKPLDNLYLWFLSLFKSKEMTKEQLYTLLQTEAKKVFDKFEKYAAESASQYVELLKRESNTIEFRVGNKRYLLEYLFRKSETVCLFKTYIITHNAENYGTFKLVPLSDLNFILDREDLLYFELRKIGVAGFERAGVNVDLTVIREFPKDYIRQIEMTDNEF